MFENFDIAVCEVFKEAENQKNILHHEFVGTEHLLLAILKKDASIAKKVSNFNLSYDSFYNEVKSNLGGIYKKSKTNIYTPLLKKVINKAMEESDKVSNKDLLFHILDEGEGVAIRLLMGMNVDVDAIYNSLKSDANNNIDLEVYKVGKVLNDYINIDEKVIGRDKEINLLIETLLRKKKNNPLLLGDAGVGKSAIVEEFTRRIITGDVPDDLLNFKVVMLEMGSLVSGTRYRGEFEERLNTIIKEVTDNSNIILFIDEIHTLVGAGAAEGAIAASDILKPYLARGDIKCIGATTKNEYEKYFSEDKALLRRFEPIFVKEPDEEETCHILKSIKNEYCNYHKVNIKDDVIDVLVHLANIYFPNRKNPDKSIELLDSVMSYVKLKCTNEIVKIKEMELKKVNCAKVLELEKGNFKEALKSNVQENKLKEEIKKLKNGNKAFITKDDIIDVLEYKNNIILTNKKIHNIESVLNGSYDKKIINKIMKMLNSYGLKTLLLQGNCGNFINDLTKALGYEYIKVTDEDNFEKIFNKIKYYPSLLIEINNSENFAIKKWLKKITKDKIVEYNDEYINFNNAIIVIKEKTSNIGFAKEVVSDFPIDEIIVFNKIKLAN